MAGKKIMTEDAKYTQYCYVHVPPSCIGGGSYPASNPGQSKFFIRGKRVVIEGEQEVSCCPLGCTSITKSSSQKLYVSGKRVVLEGDLPDNNPHTQISSKANQDVAFSN